MARREKGPTKTNAMRELDSAGIAYEAREYEHGVGVPGRHLGDCLLYTSPSPRDKRQSRMPSSA